MAEKSTTREIRTAILRFAAGAFIVIGMAIGLVSSWQLYNEMKKNQERQLMRAVADKKVAIQEFLDGAKDSAMQVTSRTAIREKLEAYYTGKVPLEELTAFTEAKLLDAKERSSLIVGISRVDRHGSPIAHVGESIPQQLWVIPQDGLRVAEVGLPFAEDGKALLVVAAPVLDRGLKRVATDIILVDLSRLRSIVENPSNLGPSEEVFLGMRNPKTPVLIFGSSSVKESQFRTPIDDSLINEALRRAFLQESGMLDHVNSESQPYMVAYAPIAGANWGLAIRVSKDEFYGPMWNQLFLTGAFIIVAVLLGTLGMIFVIRPLTGKLLFRAEDLEQEIGAKTAQLYSELAQRKKAEEALTKARDELEQRVAERTEELASLNKELALDITERKKAEEALRRLNRELVAVSDCNQVLVRAENEQTLLNDICRIVCNEAGYCMAWVGYVGNDDAKTIRPVAWAGAEEGYLEDARLAWANTERGRGPVGMAIREGKSDCIQDFTTDPHAAPWRERAAERGYRSSIALPLKDQSESTFGVLCIYSTEPNAFTPDEIRLLEELSGDLAFGIGVLRTRIERNLAEEALTLRNKINEIFLTFSGNEMYGEVLQVILEAMKSKYGIFAYIDEQGAAIAPSLTRDVWEKCLVPEKSIVFPRDTWGNSIWARAITEKRSIYANEPFDVPEGHIPINRGLVVPILYQGEVIGHFLLGNKETDYDDQDKENLEGIARSISAILNARIQSERQEQRRRQAEEELKRLTLRNEMILNSAGEGIYGTDIDGNIVFMNQAAQSMLGITMPDVLGKNSHQTFHHTKADGKPYPIEECPLHDALIDGKSCSGKHEAFWTNDGRMFYVEHVNTPLVLNGVVVGAVVVFRDITERKQAEQALRDSEERYRTVADFTYDWEYWVAADGKLLYVSPSCERITGYSAQEFLDDPGLLVRIVHMDDLDDVMNHFHVARKVDHEISYSLDFRIRHRDGRTLWVNHACRPVYGKEGQPLGRRACNRDITDRKKAEEALREREEFLSSIVENIPNMIFIKDAKELRFVRINKAGEALLGSKREDLITKDDYDFFPKGQADFFTQKDMEVLESGHVYDIPEETIETKTGRRILHTKKIPILDKSGNPIYLLGISEDITERKRAEEERLARLQFIEHMDKVNRALQGTNDLEQMMQDVLDAVYSIFDCDRTWLFYPCDPDAPTFRVPMEVTKPEYPGARILNVDQPMPPDMAENLLEALESVGPVTYTAGTEKPVNKVSADQFGVKSMMMVALYPKVGKPWAFGLHQCSYARVWTSDEERLFQEIGRRLADGLTSLLSYRGLEESEAKYRRIVETANEGIWMLGPDTMTASVNVRMAEMLGYFAEEMIGRAVTDFMFDADVPDHLQEMENHRRDLSEHYERRFRRKDGEIMWALVSATPIFDDEHHFNGAFAMFTDITERKRAEEEKERLHGQLLQAQKMESLGTLAGGIAHDFNNLLQIVIGYSDMLLFRMKPTDPDYEPLHAIREAGKGGAELAKGILAFSRRLEPNARPIDLNHEIIRAQKMLERTMPKMITIQILLADKLMTVNADPGQMEQILLNLVVNAQHAMPDGGRLTIETVNVTLDEEYSRTHLGVEPGKYVLLMVSDTGKGMGKEVIEHIFEPFYTTKGPGEGTGLGLAMVFGIVKSHKGHITCYSELGTGTAFKIYLPAIVKEIEQDPAVTQQMPAFGTETILLVDDEESIRKLGEEMLRMAGHNVLIAANGIEALGVYRSSQDRIALVLLDLMMPEMGGKRCLEELLKINPGVRVVIASGYSADTMTQEMLASGAKGFVNKPYNLRRLLEVVREVLDAK